MSGRIYWIDETWLGKLAVAARPRGGDWLSDELTDWKHAGVDSVLSLLTSSEEGDLGLQEEGSGARLAGLDFFSFPIEDRQVPRSEAKLSETLDSVSEALSEGKNVLVHCRQGVGRSGLVAACLLVKKGMSPGAAVDKISSVRGVAVPETEEQREWIDHYATAFTK